MPTPSSHDMDSHNPQASTPSVVTPTPLRRRAEYAYTFEIFVVQPGSLNDGGDKPRRGERLRGFDLVIECVGNYSG